jgi:hypothetical protein
MKLKLIAVAAFAVCGSSAFAACDATTALKLVNTCAPEVTVYMAGASAQAPAVKTIMLATNTVFDTTKPFAIVTNNATGQLSTGDNTLGAKNTTIYYGTSAGKRTAVVYNVANGSFAGVKQMTEGTGTGSLFNEQISQGLLTAAQEKAGTALACNPGSTPTVSGYILSSQASAVVCPVIPFTYTTTAPAGGVKGVQLALADVGPDQASLGVLTAGKWTDAKFPVTVTGMQGFGVMVNNVALTALINREIAAGRIDSSCAGKTGVTITAACQPNLSHADMTALVTGKATGATFGVAADTAIAYFRRVPFSGTQASSNITFAGQAATEGFKAADILAGKVTATGYATLAAAGTVDASGNYANTVGTFTTYSKVGSGDVITGVSGNTTALAFGVVSLEKVYAAGTTSTTNATTGVVTTAANGDLKGATWVKLGGISPNFKADGTLDSKQRVGMQAGYPMQFEMVAIKNAANDKTPALKAVVDSIVTALADPTYDLAGIAYIGTPAANATAAEVAKYAKYTRGGLGNNYAPLSVK